MNTPEKQKKLLLIYTNYSSFVKADYEILSSSFQVTRYKFRPEKGGILLVVQFIKQIVYLLINCLRYDFLLIWFADTHAFLPVLAAKLFRKKSAIVIGGFDAVSIPELNYGLFCANKPRQILAKFAIRNASFLLPVDGTLVENTNYYADKTGKGLPVGVRHFVKGIKGEIRIVPTGYDPGFWKPVAGIVRHKSVVTVGSIPDWKRWYLKGCDFLAQVAAELPEMPFHIYGVGDAMMAELRKSSLPENLFLHGLVTTEELPAIYSSHQIYAQLSMSEGLPNVLCEAMLCGCIPVGSDVNGIPGVTGDKNLIISEKEIEKALSAFTYAAILAENNSELFINRIKENFPAKNRSIALLSMINE